jgi:hypothetical protein
MNHIAISIQYAGLTLPVVKDETGTDCVPLKPLCDLFDLKWETQRMKVSEDFYKKYLGVCIIKALVATPVKGGADTVCAPVVWGSDDQSRDHTFIRLDRVAAFLMTISPSRVRAAGNTSGADFLEAKLTEWADALHDYETFGVAHNPRHADALLALRRATAIAKVANIKDAKVRAVALKELGIDLGAAEAGNPTGQSGQLFPVA